MTDKERYTDRGAISQIYIRISNKRVVGYFMYDTIIESEDQEDIYDNLNKFVVQGIFILFWFKNLLFSIKSSKFKVRK